MRIETVYATRFRYRVDRKVAFLWGRRKELLSLATTTDPPLVSSWEALGLGWQSVQLSFGRCWSAWVDGQKRFSLLISLPRLELACSLRISAVKSVSSQVFLISEPPKSCNFHQDSNCYVKRILLHISSVWRHWVVFWKTLAVRLEKLSFPKKPQQLQTHFCFFFGDSRRRCSTSWSSRSCAHVHLISWAPETKTSRYIDQPRESQTLEK